jgi:dynactin complex subunit
VQKELCNRNIILAKQSKELDDVKESLQSQLSLAEKKHSEDSNFHRRKAAEV